MLLAFLHPGIAAPLACRPLIFLAKISYGLYLCHPLLFTLVNAHWPIAASSNASIFPQLLLRFFAEAAASIAIATLSRYTIEKYFLSRKPQHPGTSRHHSAAGEIA